MTQFTADQLQEKLEVLDGSRARQTRRAAVRIEDVDALLTMPDKLSTAEFTGEAPNPATITATAIARTVPDDFAITTPLLSDRTNPVPAAVTATYAAGATPTAAEFAAVVNDLVNLRAFGVALSTTLNTAPNVIAHNAVYADLIAIGTFCHALKVALPQPTEYNKVVTDLGAIITQLAGLAAIVPTAEHLNAMRKDVQEQLTRLHEVAVALQKRVLP